jgi:hypothetical protein
VPADPTPAGIARSSVLQRTHTKADGWPARLCRYPLRWMRVVVRRARRAAVARRAPRPGARRRQKVRSRKSLTRRSCSRQRERTNAGPLPARLRRGCARMRAIVRLHLNS